MEIQGEAIDKYADWGKNQEISQNCNCVFVKPAIYLACKNNTGKQIFVKFNM